MEESNDLCTYSVNNLVPTIRQLEGFNICSLEDFSVHVKSLRHNHRHDFYSLLIIESGFGSHTIDSISYKIKKNRIFLMTYGQIHSWEELKNAKGFMINFTKSFYNHIYTGNRKIKSDLINLGDVPYIDVDASSIKEWISLANLVKNEYRRSKNEYKELICLYLKAALVKYKRYFNLGTDSILLKKNHKSTLAQNFKELIDMKFKEWKFPKEYANEMCITPHYLSTISKAKFGKSAGIIIKERIILEAERLLKSTDLTVNEIGGRLGFSDKSNFNKYFKKYMYCTPEAFRNESSRNIELQDDFV